MTHDMWQVTPDTWYVTHGGGWTFSKIVKSLALMFGCNDVFEELEGKDELLNYFNDKGVCWKTPGTPGLLNIYKWTRKGKGTTNPEQLNYKK